jgi:predicted ATPase/DNA-binding winged helix-turn-helix (wHTH) protein
MDWMRLGALELHPAERLLLRDGQAVELGARAFDLLLVLAEQPGRLVTKATLLERVWPKLVVDENNLPTQVASLRRALGAGAIRTVPGFGYRLELPVSPSGGVPSGLTAMNGAATPGIAQGHGSALAGVPAQVAPTRAAAALPPWPGRLAPLVGRERELAELHATLARASLVTLVGVPGVGKTRLAQELLALAASESRGAVAWVALQPLATLQQVPGALALALGLPPPDAANPFDSLAQALGQQPLFAVFDGVEHLGATLAAPLAALLQASGALRILLTSQAPLGVAGEQVYRLQALAVPPAGAEAGEVAGHSAVQLFAQRAAAAAQGFELNSANTAQVAAICRRLDGNPLALELAAARLPALGAAALLERLDDRFRLLRQAGQGGDARHGALHAAFDWSYSLLAPAEQRVFNRLAAFAGSFALPVAARAVADDSIDAAEAVDLIGRLVDRSLLMALPTEPPRYQLAETARYYALERLRESGQEPLAQRRMAESLLVRLDVIWQEYWSLDEAIWLSRYLPELDNLRAASTWAAAHDGDLAVALYGSAWPLLVETDLHEEGRARFAQVAPHLHEGLAPARLGRFWEAVASLESTRQWDRARYAAELAAGFHGRGGDARARCYALLLLAWNARDDDAAAEAAWAAARALEDPAWPARLLAFGDLTECVLASTAGRLAEARAACARAVRHALATSERQALAATVCLVELDIASGEIFAALQLVRPLAQGLKTSGRRETRFELLSLGLCALLLAGEHEEARAYAAELHELAQRLDQGRLHEVLDAMACLACSGGRHEAAARIVVAADRAMAAHGLTRRRPAAERMRATVAHKLDEVLGPKWLATAAAARGQLDEAGACALALGFTD